MNMKSIEDVFIHLLSDTYSAEKQLTRGLAKLARAASSEKLSAAFNAHLEETQGQIERIDQIIEQESKPENQTHEMRGHGRINRRS